MSEHSDLRAAIDRWFSQKVPATTISCSGKDITIACDDHDTKQAVMDALTGDGEPVAHLHAMVEPGYQQPHTMLSVRQENPWAHWVQEHIERCTYTCLPLYAALRPSQAAPIPPHDPSGVISDPLSSGDSEMQGRLPRGEEFVPDERDATTGGGR